MVSDRAFQILKVNFSSRENEFYFVIVIWIRNFINKSLPIQVGNRLNPCLQRNFILDKFLEFIITVVLALVVSARSDDTDKVSALDAGADDYLTKPFSVEELLARLRVALRRVRYDTSRAGDQASIYENGELRIDYAAGCVYRGGTEIHLTPIEYKLICVLAKNTGKVLTHNYLLNEVWGSPAASDTPSLRVFMATLRKKIEEDPSHPRYIQTHIGVGYRMIRQ